MLFERRLCFSFHLASNQPTEFGRPDEAEKAPSDPAIAVGQIPILREGIVWERFSAEAGGSLAPMSLQGSRTKS
jgi:hypothetical protein